MQVIDYCLSFQKITRVKKIDEDEDEDSELTEEEIAALSRGTYNHSSLCDSVMTHV